MVGREHVPEPRVGREDDHDARPHERRPDEPRDRRRLVRDRAHRLRDRVRLRLRRAARLVRRGGRADARDATGRAGVRARALLPGQGRPQQPAARPGAPADPDRRQRRAEDAATVASTPTAGTPAATSNRPAQGRGAPPLVRRGRPRRVGDRADAPGRDPDHPRHRGRGTEGRRGDEASATAAGAGLATARSAPRSWSPSAGRRTSTSASSTSTSTAPRRSTTRRSSAWRGGQADARAQLTAT